LGSKSADLRGRDAGLHAVAICLREVDGTQRGVEGALREVDKGLVGISDLLMGGGAGLIAIRRDTDAGWGRRRDG
jgi:hypothetical protein